MEYDIIGAKSAGMVPILYNRKNSSIVNDREFLEVESIYEIEKLIKEI